MSTVDLNSRNDQPQFASVTAIAAMLGVDKAAVSRRAARLEASGAIQTVRDGRQKLINVAAYLAATEQTLDAVRAANGAQASPDKAPPADPTLAAQQARHVAIRADLAQIDLDKARGVLVPIDDVRESMTRAAGELVRSLEALPGKADDIAAALTRDGVPGLRVALKDIVRSVRERLASAMTILAAETAEDGEE